MRLVNLIITVLWLTISKSGNHCTWLAILFVLLAYLGWCRVPAAAWRSNRDQGRLTAVVCSHGQVDEVVDPLVVRQPAPEFGVPLLSQEGRTRCLLPGATAPYPVLDQAMMMFPAELPRFVAKFLAVSARFVSKFLADPPTFVSFPAPAGYCYCFDCEIGLGG